MGDFKYSDNRPRILKMAGNIGYMMQKINEAMMPVIKSIRSFQIKFNEISDKLIETSRPIFVIIKLGKAQFVYWDFLTNEFAEEILSTNNINRTLREISVKDKFCKVDKTIDSISSNVIIQPHNRVFSQAVVAYRNKQYELTAVGIISVIDGLLSGISNDNATSIFKRATAILEKVVDTDSLENEEFLVLALIWTFSETMQSISTKSDFNGKEPKSLNRHWIMHGRSRRRRTQLDCIKLFNLVYGILLLDELGKTERLSS